MPKTLANWAPYYLWLADEGFVESDKSFQDDSGWGTVIELAGPHFTVRIEDDPFGPIALIGSGAGRWYQVAEVVKFAAPDAFPDYNPVWSETFPDRESQASELRRRLQEVVAFFQHIDAEAFDAEIDRQRKECWELSGKRIPADFDVAAHYGFKKDSKEWREFLSQADKAMNLIGNAFQQVFKEAEKNDKRK